MSENSFYSQEYKSYLNDVIKNHFSHLCQVQKSFRLSLKGISRLVMLDCYSQKDKKENLRVGDLVLTVIKHDSKFPSRGIGTIIEKIDDQNGVRWLIKIEDEFANNIDPDLFYKGISTQILKQDFEI